MGNTHTVEMTSSTGDTIKSVVIFTSTYAACFFVWRLISRPRDTVRRPPSLPWVPVLGSFPFLGDLDKIHITLTDMAAKLGNVYTICLGNSPRTILNGYSAIHEAYVKRANDFADRPRTYVNAEGLNPGAKGIVNHVHDINFKRDHKLSLKILKEFGFGQGRLMDSRIHVEVQYLIDHVKGLKGVKFDPMKAISLSVMNIIASIIFGRRFDTSSSDLEKLIETASRLVKFLVDLTPMECIHALRFIPKHRRLLREMISCQNELFELLDRTVEETLSGKAETCFASHFIAAEGENSDRDQLRFTLRDLVIAGAETSTVTLLWHLIFMASHQDVQDRLRAEIDSVAGTKHLPSFEDLSKMPNVESVMLEVFRLKAIAPLALARTTSCDTEVQGFHIPAGQMVMANLYSVHMDAKEWPDPTEFKPERFLNEDGQIIKRDSILPFSLGRRSCFGEIMAKQEIFVFLTGLLQQFYILPPDDQTIKLDCTLENGGFFVTPKPFEIRMIARECKSSNSI